MAKGSSFEREVAKQLSLWWSGGERDDLIWRTAMSGGRATVRHRQGKRTAGQAGDLTATDDQALPLFKLVAFELKRGYAQCTLSSLMDRSDSIKPVEMERWIVQAKRSAKMGDCKYWMIIHKRNNKQTLAVFPRALLNYLQNRSVPLESLVTRGLSYVGPIRTEDKASSPTKTVSIASVLFEEFLQCVDPCCLGASPPSSSKPSGKARSTRKR
jgi:hypothetical protein